MPYGTSFTFLGFSHIWGKSLTGHHAPPPDADIKVKPYGCYATLTPLAVVA
jgi:hypothetical protein